MIKNVLSRVMGLSLRKTHIHPAIYKKLIAPRFSFCTNKQFPGDKGVQGKHESSLKMDNHHDHTNCSHQHHHHETPSNQHHHHHHNGQPCNHDHSHDHEHQNIELSPEVLNYKTEDHNIDNNSFRTITTKDAISILDKIPGNKDAQNMQIYALAFTCNVCQTRAIRSFTKHAYEKGVVLIKCQGCQKVHLIADNLGWFQDQPTNIQKFSDVKKASHSADVLAVLDKLFEESQKPMTEEDIAELNKKITKK